MKTHKPPILLVHGAWVTTESWSGFRRLYEERGYQVVVPAWPFLDRPVRELRARPDSRLAKVTIKDLVDHYEKEILALPEPPILIGHSFGGLIVQMLLDRRLGCAGVALDAGPPRGVLPSPTAIGSALPVLLSWLGWRRILTMSFQSFSKNFANTVPSHQLMAIYDTHIVPAPGRIYFQAALGVGNGIQFGNPDRPPLLLVTASKDRTSTPSMVRAMVRKHRKALSTTDYVEFPNRSHWLIAEEGWEEVAEKVLAWAEIAVENRA